MVFIACKIEIGGQDLVGVSGILICDTSKVFLKRIEGLAKNLCELKSYISLQVIAEATHGPPIFLCLSSDQKFLRLCLLDFVWYTYLNFWQTLQLQSPESPSTKNL
ncbi:hypothetical protein Glove_232g180 [Diversispora epigaea]|uniref:Uncharacterized protein n=1 Tax=Diversispora epigaea TaxID=1348612 RepID=A0A397IC61_9GLOM|nr:hypothetical protein Glove_232g180 [Diversispora epigaea]